MSTPADACTAGFAGIPSARFSRAVTMGAPENIAGENWQRTKGTGMRLGSCLHPALREERRDLKGIYLPFSAACEYILASVADAGVAESADA